MRYGAKRESISDRRGSALKGYVPGAFLNPRKNELVALYRLRYRMAMDEKKYDAARVFLDKDPVARAKCDVKLRVGVKVLQPDGARVRAPDQRDLGPGVDRRSLGGR